MVKSIAAQGFKDGLQAGRKKKQNFPGIRIKYLIANTLAIDDKEIAKQIAKEHKVSRAKAFKFALKYVKEFDRGVRESTYSAGE